MSWEEKDIEIMDRIRENTENLEIPKTLSPENMMKKLEGEEQKRRKNMNWIIKLVAAAACISAVTLSMWQYNAMDGGVKKFIPQTGNEQKKSPDKNNDYNSIYKKLKSAEKIKGGFKEDIYYGNADLEGDVVNRAEAAEDSVNYGTSGTENKVSETNVQVEGIDEADVVKNDREYIYALDLADNKVSIVSMSDEKEVSQIKVIDNYLSFSNADMFVSGDILAVVGTYADNETKVNIFDISDRENPVQVNSLSQQGNYNTSRLSGDYLYVMSDSYIRGKLSENNCVPRLEGEQIEPECVSISENVTSLEYGFIISIDLRTPETVLDKKAVTKDSSNGYTYMSAENIYVTNYSYSDGVTTVSKIGYKDGKFSDVVEGKVDGWLYGQFAMDEYNGYLRLVSTYQSKEVNENESFAGRQVNVLYVLDGALQTVGKIDGIARGERIYSARFSGDIGYFVTYYETDPLFRVDLSDPSNPVILGELEITGYSDYLHPWGDDKMVGIGYVEDFFKLSMFEVNGNGEMSEITRKVFKDCHWSPAANNHKALMIDEELNLIGFLTDAIDYNVDDAGRYGREDMVYKVYSYTDGGFEERLSKEVGSGNWENYDETQYTNWCNARGVYAGGKLYIVIPGNSVSVYDINTMETLGEIELG